MFTADIDELLYSLRHFPENEAFNRFSDEDPHFIGTVQPHCNTQSAKFDGLINCHDSLTFKQIEERLPSLISRTPEDSQRNKNCFRITSSALCCVQAACTVPSPSAYL